MKLEKKLHIKHSLCLKYRSSLPQYAKFGVKNLSFLQITESQLKALEWLICKKLKILGNKKSYKLWSKKNLNLSLTRLSLESRMGKGKGSIISKATFFKPGNIIFEIDKVNILQMKILIIYINKKFSGKLIIVQNFVNN